MLFSRKSVPADPHPVAALDEHIRAFHEGLDEIEERLLDRHTTVNARLADLEDEAKALRGAMGDVVRHRGNV